MVELIVATYRSSGGERRKYHDMSFERDDAFAREALFLLETPVDALAGIASWNGQIPEDRWPDFVRQLESSPLAESLNVQQRLRDEGAERMALVLERADHLRLLLLQLLRRSAA